MFAQGSQLSLPMAVKSIVAALRIRLAVAIGGSEGAAADDSRRRRLSRRQALEDANYAAPTRVFIADLGIRNPRTSR